MVLVSDYDMLNFFGDDCLFAARKDFNKYYTLPFLHKHGTSDFFPNVSF